MKRAVTFFILALFLYSQFASGQAVQRRNSPRTSHHEMPDQGYVARDRSSMPRSPGGRYAGMGYVTAQVNVDAGGNNILGDAANEPSIAIDPVNPSRMVIGWRQFDHV